jgi:uncharacterized membrane protein
MSRERVEDAARGGAERRASLAVWLASAPAVALLVAIAVPPILEARAGTAPSSVRLLFAPLCHQIEERSFFLAGSPLAVCARCTGLYLGGVFGLACAAALARGRQRQRAVPRRWIVALVLPTLADGVLATLGLSPFGTLGRFLLGLPAGAGLGVLLATGIHDLGLMIVGDCTRGEPASGRSIAEEWR